MEESAARTISARGGTRQGQLFRAIRRSSGRQKKAEEARAATEETIKKGRAACRRMRGEEKEAEDIELKWPLGAHSSIPLSLPQLCSPHLSRSAARRAGSILLWGARVRARERESPRASFYFARAFLRVSSRRRRQGSRERSLRTFANRSCVCLRGGAKRAPYIGVNAPVRDRAPMNDRYIHNYDFKT